MVEKKCKTCGWSKLVPDVKGILICDCRLSGAYETTVIDDEGKDCNRWKKASDEYLKFIGEL